LDSLSLGTWLVAAAFLRITILLAFPRIGFSIQKREKNPNAARVPSLAVHNQPRVPCGGNKTFIIKRPLRSSLHCTNRPRRTARHPTQPESTDGTARQDGLRRDEPGPVLAAAVATRQAGLLRAQPGRLAPGRPPPALRRPGEDVARRVHPGRVAAPLPPLPPQLGRRRAPLQGVVHGPAPLLRPAPLRRRRRRGVAPAQRPRQRRGQRRGRGRREGVDARRARVGVEVLRARGVRVLRRFRLLLARALGRQQVVQASRRRQGSSVVAVVAANPTLRTAVLLVS
jgi:hypothetical protein